MVGRVHWGRVARRQASQTLSALLVATLALLAALPLVHLLAVSSELHASGAISLSPSLVGSLPLPLLLAAADELNTASLRKRRPRPPGAGLVVLLLIMAGVLALSVLRERRGLGGYGSATGIIVTALYVPAEPLARFVRLAMSGGRRCRARKGHRLLWAVAVRAMFGFTGNIAFACVYVTLSVDLKPWQDTVLMGLVFPLAQWAAMNAMSAALGHTRRKAVQRDKKTKLRAGLRSAEKYSQQPQQPENLDGQEGEPASMVTSPPAAVATVTCPQPASPLSPGKPSGPHSSDVAPAVPPDIALATTGATDMDVPTAPKTTAATAVAAAPSVEDAERFDMPVVMMIEMLYTATGFTLLLLFDDERAFVASLLGILGIELAHVALYVRARHTLAKVLDERTALSLMGSNDELRKWLLYQEQGEKCGMLLAVGLLATLHALFAPLPVILAVSFATLARRAAVMLLLGSVVDIIKDVVSQRIGLKDEGPIRAPLPCNVVMPMMILALLTLYTLTIAVSVLAETSLDD